MNIKDKKSKETDSLRKKAEERLNEIKSFELKASNDASEIKKLVHELQVHQVELEMQNEELIQARDKLESLLGKYTGLYDFAPVGYFTFDRNGKISEVNLTGATFLGIERSRLINVNFLQFLKEDSYSVFLNSLKKVFEEKDTEKVLCEVTISEKIKSMVNAHIEGVISEDKQFCRAVLIDITELRKAEAQLHELTRHLENIREEERVSLSKILHDSFGQSLTGLKMKISSLEKNLIKIINIEENPGITEQFNSMKSLLDDIVALTSKLSMDLVPSVLESFGLLSAIMFITEDFGNKSGIECVFTTEIEKTDVEPIHAIGIYRILQELLTNVVRHANATKIHINLFQQNNSYIIEVKDNGKGIRREDISSPFSLGIFGMKERVLAFGGNISFAEYDGKGTKVSINVPIKEK